MEENVNKIIGIAVAILVVAVVFPIAIDQLAGLEGVVQLTESVWNENIGIGDEVPTLEFNGTLDNVPVQEHSIVIKTIVGGIAVRIYDDNGVLSNDNALGTIAYESGDWTLTFDTGFAPDNNENIYANYRYITGEKEYPAGLITLLKVLLPILAVIGVILYITKTKK